MKVALFSDAAAKQGGFGLSRYVRALAVELDRQDVSTQLVATKVEDPASRAIRIPGGRRLLATAWSMVDVPRVEWFVDADLIHVTELDYPIGTKKPLVFTVHDLGPLTHPEYFGAAHPWLLRAALKQACAKADRIIAVSHATATAVADLSPHPLGGRLTVVHSGIEPEFFAAPPATSLDDLPLLPGPDTPIFLWAGTTSPRKNLVRTLEAFERAAPSIDHHLVIVGGAGWDSAELFAALVRSPVAERVHRLGYVSDLQLRALYHRADAFLYPSLLEGFGFPILEAMAAGCPVVTSNLSSMPEIAGDAALLIDPFDIDDLAQAMTNLARDAGLRERLASLGCVRAGSFRWDTAARHVTDIYRSILG